MITNLYFEDDNYKLYNGSSDFLLMGFKENTIDMTLTSPPYDDLRAYKGMTWNDSVWRNVLRQLYRVTKPGGVVVWIVNDATLDGSETGTSFRQALHAIECGFRLHDTMIWNKGGFSAVGSTSVRYGPVFEYMFVFSKGKPKSFNPLKDRPNKSAGKKIGKTTHRQKDGSTKPGCDKKGKVHSEFGIRFNIWENPPLLDPYQRQKHPAQFPIKLAEDHIRSWTNEGDVVLDCFAGAGTALRAAKNLNRPSIGIELSAEYCNVIKERMKE